VQTVERWVTRSDAWTPEDDERLATLVLHHIRTGSTQLRAFEEAANTLGRTAAACGYRWNGVVRKHYREQIDQAKKERKAVGRLDHPLPSQNTVYENSATSVTSSDSMREVIHFLQEFDKQYQKLRHQMEALESERQALLERIHALESERRTPEPVPVAITPEQLEEDSKALFAIMERARKLLVSDVSKSRGE
jgi:prespore-specific regulator